MDISSLYQLYLQYPSVQTDTRKLKEGDIFFALKGPNFNGNLFVLQALAAGAAYAVVDEQDAVHNDRCVLVNDVLETMQQLALHHRKTFSIPFIGITGSNGKTTTKELVTAVLRQQYITYATDGNLNNHIGVPLTILKIKADAQMAIIEMGANHLREIASYCVIALPTHGLITNCGKAHIEGFGSEEGVRKGKGELYDFIREHGGTIFRNTDLPYLEDMASGIAHQVTYGRETGNYLGKPAATGVFLDVNLLQPEQVAIHSQLVGEYNFPNVMTAVAVGLHFGIGAEKIKTAIEQYNPDNSRSQWLKKGTNNVILDAYNANPSSMKAAITNFMHAKLDNKMLWIGAMKEMGTAEEAEHRELVDFISTNAWKEVILVGKEFEQMHQNFRWFEHAAEAAAYVRKNPPQDASILIKGSRGSKMETLFAELH